jgi:hypothetical protein
MECMIVSFIECLLLFSCLFYAVLIDSPWIFSDLSSQVLVWNLV